MNEKTTALLVILALIVGAIFYLESTKTPRIDAGSSDIPIQTSLDNANQGIQEERATSPEKTAEKEPVQEVPSRILEKQKVYPRAKELIRPFGYINTDNKTIKIADNIGKKVIMVDFWTYSCINCQRTLPYLEAWHDKYEDDGLLIIGVHTPEFEFEKKLENVQMAVDKYGVKYPVVLDNAYTTWQAYENHYWPHKYLIDIDGFIVYDHIGEGGYDDTEKIIQQLLKERNTVLGLNNAIDTGMINPNASSVDFSKIRTPELYLGYGFSRGQIGNTEGFQPGKIVDYKISGAMQKNLFYMEGKWLNANDYMESQEDGSVFLEYSANKANIVAGADMPINVTVLLDGKEYKTLQIGDFDLYVASDLPDYGSHDLELRAPAGLKLYTFTFG